MRNIVEMIFGKEKTTPPEETPESRLAMALNRRGTSRPAPLAVIRARPVAMAEKPPDPARETMIAKLLFAFDATASREHAWAIALQLTDAALNAMPGHLRVALAVQGGNRVKLFTGYEKDIAELRRIASGVRCQAGTTKFLDILARATGTEGLTSVVLAGDVFEESPRRAMRLANALAAQNTRVFILLDEPYASAPDETFAKIAERTGGCVLPFNAHAIDQMRDLLSAIGVLSVGGTEMLAAKQETMPAARLLLQHMKGNPK